jgi:hypothetical protein
LVENYPEYSASWLLTGSGERSILTEGEHIYPSVCYSCERKEQRIVDLLETIASLKEANAALRELLSEIRDKKM